MVWLLIGESHNGAPSILLMRSVLVGSRLHGWKVCIVANINELIYQYAQSFVDHIEAYWVSSYFHLLLCAHTMMISFDFGLFHSTNLLSTSQLKSFVNDVQILLSIWSVHWFWPPNTIFSSFLHLGLTCNLKSCKLFVCINFSFLTV